MHCWRFVSSIVLGHLPRAEAESHRLYSAPRPLSSSTSFSSLHITKGNLQPLAEGEFCNGTSFCLRQEPVSSEGTIRIQQADHRLLREYFSSATRSILAPLVALYSPQHKPLHAFAFTRLKCENDERGRRVEVVKPLTAI